MTENGIDPSDQVDATSHDCGSGSNAVEKSSLGRRAILAGLAGAAAVTVASGSTPASAASGAGDQGALIMGSNDVGRAAGASTPGGANTSSAATVIKASPNFGNFLTTLPRVVFRADATPAGDVPITALEGIGTGGGAGVRAVSASGIALTANGAHGIQVQSTVDGVSAFASSGRGIRGSSVTGIGGEFTGGSAALRLVPRSQIGAPTTGAHELGELVVDSTGVLFLCKTSGTPGTWVQVSETTSSATPGPAGPAGPAGVSAPSFRVLPTPERFIDTRSALGGVQGPLPAGATSTFQMTGRNGESANVALQIPDSATILVGNLSVIGGPSVPIGSFVTMWPSGARPTTSSISFGPGAIVANAYTVGLAAAGGHGNMNVFAQQQCDYIVDVVGYFS